ncbi:MAG: hypothetical protein HQ526_00625 [Actinobacteria bacterium]|nr:hypothetical protein [Actinomycetota bacterium]
MTDHGLEALMRAATRISSGEPLTNDLMNEEGVPVPLRLITAAVALTAADRPVNKKLITTAAPAARSATYRDHAGLLDQAKTVLPALVQAQLQSVGVGVSVASLAAQLEAANTIIHEERTRREQAEMQLAHIASYARELHWALKPEHEAALRERAETVRVLRPLPDTDA